MSEYHDCESRTSCDEVRLDLDAAKAEIERLRAILACARVELTNVKNSEDTVAMIDAALFGESVESGNAR